MSALTTFTTPWLIRVADPLAAWLATHLPKGIIEVFSTYTAWLQTIHNEDRRTKLQKAIKKILLQIFYQSDADYRYFYCRILLRAYLSENAFPTISLKIVKAWIWGICLTLSMPCLIAAYQKIVVLGLIFAEMAVSPNETGTQHTAIPKIIAQIIPIACLLGVVLMVVA